MYWKGGGKWKVNKNRRPNGESSENWAFPPDQAIRRRRKGNEKHKIENRKQDLRKGKKPRGISTRKRGHGKLPKK